MNAIPAVEELARDESLAAEKPPASVLEADYEKWHKALKALRTIIPAVEEEIAGWLTARGLTATSPKHIWLHEDLEGFDIREGLCLIPETARPAYMHGIEVNICRFRLPGVVIKFGETIAEKFTRLRRNPKAGELEVLLRKIEQQAREANHVGVGASEQRHQAAGRPDPGSSEGAGIQTGGVAL